MASIFAHVLAALAGVMNNGMATFTWYGGWNESECPEELL